MQHPFCVLQITTKEAAVDVNVHPTKQEVRFDDEIAIADIFKTLVFERLHQREDIAEVTLDEEIEKEKEQSKPVAEERTPEPFEKARLQQMREKITKQIHADTPYERKYQEFYQKRESDTNAHAPKQELPETSKPATYEQTSFLTREARAKHHIIGQVFDTYWLIEHDNKLYIIDQHAAHEKVLYERMMKQLKNKEMTTQYVSPPIILSLTRAEQDILERFADVFAELGYVISPFGGNEFAIEGVPGNLFSFDVKTFFMELLASCDSLKENDGHDMILEKIASMSCKAAIKGNNHLSRPEIEALLEELLSLENPYHCPHGRPTIIAMTKYEIEKKFKRIV